jgi:hypothetical protein
VALRFLVRRVLQPLEQLLEVRDPRFERLEAIRLRLARVAARSVTRGGETVNLPDPRHKSIPLTQHHRPPRRFGRAGRTSIVSVPLRSSGRSPGKENLTGDNITRTFDSGDSAFAG